MPGVRLVVMLVLLAVVVGVVGVLAWQSAPVSAAGGHALRPPWDTQLRQALAARQRFHEVLRNTPPGPLYDRLSLLASGVDAAAAEATRVARIGSAVQAHTDPEAAASARLADLVATLERSAGAAAELSLGAERADPESLARELDALRAALAELRRRELGGGEPGQP